MYLFNFSGINEVKSVLQIIIDQVSQQQTMVERLTSRVTSLEESHAKHKMILSHYSSKRHKSRKNGIRDKHGSKKIPVDDQKAQASSKLVNAKDLESHKSSNSSSSDIKMMVSVPTEKVQVSPSMLASNGGKVKNGKKLGVHNSKRRKKLKSKLTSPKPKTEPVEALTMKEIDSKSTLKREPSDESVVSPCPITDNGKALPVSEIDSSDLISVDEVLGKYENLVIHGQIASLCRKLAKEAFFGKNILKRCSPRGGICYPALPIEPLNSLKEVIFKTFPGYWDNSSEFEKLWLKCVASIEGLCTNLRKAKKQEKLSSIVRNGALASLKVKEVDDIVNPLSSEEIPKSELMPISEFLSTYGPAIEQGKFSPSTLTRKLAVEAIFGKSVLLKCTPFGRSTFPGLPVAELNLLKQTVFDCSPSYWDKLETFEANWTHMYSKLLGNVCSKLRLREARNGETRSSDI